MNVLRRGLWASLFLFACTLVYAGPTIIKGKVTDPSGQPVPGAQVAAAGRLGIDAQTTTAQDGSFSIEAPGNAGERLVVTAAGFATATVKAEAGANVKLEIAPQTDSVRVVGSAIDVAASEQGSSVTVISAPEIRERNEPVAADLLRYAPGVAMAQSGSTGGVTSLFLRGGNANFTLVQVDGVTVNQFGGAYDFAHIPSEALDGIEVARGAQSAVYGAYANSGAVNFITRQPGDEPHFEVLAEGGSHFERRFGFNASATVAGFGLSATATRIDTDGPVVNSGYWNELAMLTATRRFGSSQTLTLHAQFDANDVGEPGAYGSNPQGIFTGIDRVSRSHNDTGTYFGNYSADLSSSLRLEATGSYYQNLSGFTSPFGFSYEKDWRGLGDVRAIWNVAPHYTMAFGASGGRESFTNTYVTDANFAITPLDRTDLGFYWENRIQFGRLYLNAGVRGEVFKTEAIPSDGFSHPTFAANTIGKVNPKAAVAYLLAKMSRVHASVGTGIRPPAGFDLAFTTNPALKPERTASFDAGFEQRVGDRVVLDATYFYNRYYDLIVSLGGSLTALSHFTTDNLANSRAQGAELSAGYRPARYLYLKGSYTLLRTRVLSIDHSANQAPAPFAVGQQLLRRPNNSGEFVAAFSKGKVTADLTGYFRGRTFDSEPNYGASAGLYWNPGYANIGVNLNYAVSRYFSIYGNLRNALNRSYEEIFGFPSPKLNFVTGVKITLAKAR